MKIYQIHEYSGEYEDYQDCIVGSYLNKEKAIAKKEEFQHTEDERWIKTKNCSLCPINDSDTMAENFDIVVQICSEYCSSAKITDDCYGYNCENYYCYWDKATYEIKEVEVEE